MSLEAAFHVMMTEARQAGRSPAQMGQMMIAREYGAKTPEEAAGVLGMFAAALMQRDGLKSLSGDVELTDTGREDLGGGGRLKFTIEIKMG